MKLSLRALSLAGAMLLLSPTIAGLTNINTSKFTAQAQVPSISDQKAEAERLLDQAPQLFRVHRTQEARRSIEDAIRIYRQIGDRAGEADALVYMIELHLLSEQYQEALDIAEQVLAIGKEIGDRDEEANGLLGLAKAYYGLGQYQQALNFHEQELVIERESGDREKEARLLWDIAYDYIALNQYQQAIDVLQQSLAILREVGDRELEAEVQNFTDAVKRQAEFAILNSADSVNSLLRQCQQGIENSPKTLVEVEGVLEKGDVAVGGTAIADVYSFQGCSGQQVTISMESPASDISTALTDSEGNVIAQLTSSLTTTTLPQSGVYQVFVNSPDQTTQRQYQLSVRLNSSGEGSSTSNEAAVRQERQQVIDLLGEPPSPLSPSEIPVRQAEADRLSAQGNQQVVDDNFQAALQSYKQALSIYRQTGDGQGITRALIQLADIYSQLKQYQQAIKYYELLLTFAHEAGNRQMEAAMLNNLGIAYDNLEQPQQAIERYEQSLAIMREIGNRQQELMVLDNLEKAHVELKQYQQAVEYYKQSLQIAREIGDRQLEWRSLTSLSIAYSNLGQYEQVIEFSEQSLAIAREVGKRELATSLMNLSLAYIHLGKYQPAIERSAEALSIAREIGDRMMEGGAIQLFVDAYNGVAQFADQVEIVEQALTIARETENQPGEAGLLEMLGEAYRLSGNYQRAIELTQQSLAIARDLNSTHFELNALNTLGNIYSSSKQYELSLQFYNQALTIARETGERDYEAGTLAQLCLLYSELDQYKQAIEFCEQSLSIDPEGMALFNLGTIFLKTQRYAEAETSYTKALESYERLRAGLSDTNKVAYNENLETIFNSLLFLAVVQGKTEQGLEISERGRARAFIEELALRLDSQQSAEALVAANLPTIDKIKQIAREQNATLVEYSIIPPTHELLIWVVKPTGEIEYRRVDLSTLNTPLQELVSVSREALGATRSPFVALRPREGTEEELLTQQTQRLRQLHQLLIEPIAEYLPTDPNAPVIFVPQAELFSVPFPALQDSNGTYLIDQHTILTAPSIQVLEKTRQERLQVQQANLQQALVIGNPTMPSIAPTLGEPAQTLVSLPGSEAEARAIAPLLHTQPLTGNQAKKAAIVQQMPNARIIHLATHGLFDDHSGLNSAIALAPDGTGEPGDGLLTAADLAQMKLNAELVVLSACSTGQGQITGDGVIGLSRSLITAGVPSVIVSLWSVPDAPTADLMTEFYRRFQQTGDKAQALRQAMLATRATHPNPRDWAAFTLIGEAK